MADEKKRALIVVDVQNDFCPGGTLPGEHGDEVVEPLNQPMQEFLQSGEPSSEVPSVTGVIFKQCLIDGQPTLKASNSIEKTTLPGRHRCFGASMSKEIT